MFRTIKFIAALLAVAALATACCGATVILDTIGDGSKYQVGSELARNVQLGYDSYPISGDFTAVRPTFDETLDPPNGIYGVIRRGTSGVPCGIKWQSGAPGEFNPVSGQYAGWVVQPFVAIQDATASSVEFIAQLRQNVGYDQGPGRTAYVDIIEAPVGNALPLDLWSVTTPGSVDLSNANPGKIVSAPFVRELTAGHNYWLVFAPWNVLGEWNSNGLDYANLNWAWRSIVNDSSRVSDARFNSYNGSGDFTTMVGCALGVRINGATEPGQETGIGGAKALDDGEAVSIADVVITAKTGAIGPSFFYVETPDQSSGIRIVGTTSLAIGTHVDVAGATTTVGVERAILGAVTATVPPNGDPVAPVAMNGATVGGGTFLPLMGPTGGVGANSVGLCVTLFGECGTGSLSNEFIINDGNVVGGILCRAAAGTTVPTSGYYAVTGVISLETADSDRRSVILINNAALDIVPLN